MAVAHFYEYPETTQEMAQRVSDEVNTQLGSGPPAGGIYHAEGPMDGGGWWSFDVWDSEDAARSFHDDILAPAMQAVGVPLSQPRVLPVHWESNQPQEQ